MITKWSFAYLASRHFVRKQASRIGGHIKYVTTYRDCLAISLTLSGGVNTFTWSRVPLVNSMTSLLWISVITNVTPKHAIPWDMESAGKICINYAGSLSWNANWNSKSYASSHKSHGRALVKRKKFVNPVHQHKAGCDRGKRTSVIGAWQRKIWWVPAERTRAATGHITIFRALKLYLVAHWQV